MEGWLWTTLLLCLYGFLKELRPSEPFLTEYLIDPQWVNITLQEANKDVYPVWTYSYLAVLVVVFLLTDWLRYKLIIVVEGFAYIITWCLLIFGHGVPTMQVMQFTYGVATSTEVAYYTYIYAKVPRRHYQRVTSFTRVAILLGRFISGILAQILISTRQMDYRQLNFLTLISVSLATVVSILIPNVSRTLYFHKKYVSREPIIQPICQEDEANEVCDNTKEKPDDTDCSQVRPTTAVPNEDSSLAPPTPKDGLYFADVFYHVKYDFVNAFCKNTYVLKWSVWWALGMCGNFQVGNYIQPLWETIAPSVGNKDQHIYNGGVEAATTLTGAILTFAFGYIHLNWSLIGEPVLFMISLLNGVVLILMALTNEIWVAYVGYWAFRALYQMMITVASYEVASNIKDDSYGLVFGVNTFMALLFQTMLTLVVVDDAGLALSPRTQFMVYGGFWIAISLLFVVLFLGYNFSNKSRIGKLKEKFKDEGFILNVTTNTNPEMFSINSGIEEGRRDAPIGSTEPQ